MKVFLESIELMVFVYALAAVVSYAVAGLLKAFYFMMEKNKARAEAAKTAAEGAE
jgi:hypothetical protein